MSTQTLTATKAEQEQAVEEKIQQLRELFADAPEVGKKALENALRELSSQASETPPPADRERRPGRHPSGQGLGADDHRPVRARRRQAAARVPAVAGRQPRQGADKVGTLHDMRFVFLDNDTRLLFATAFDGDWDAYIDDFVDEDPRLPGHHRLRLGGLAGDSQPGAKDYLAKHQITAEGWYVANPDLTVAETHRLEARRQGGRRVPGQDRIACSGESSLGVRANDPDP